MADLNLIQSNASDDVKREAATMLSEIRPTTLRFLADPYDDTTSTIFPLLSSILGTVSTYPSHVDQNPDYHFQLKKIKRSSPQDITDETRAFLSSTLSALLQKLKWDEDESDLDDMDEDDRQAFETLRKVPSSQLSNRRVTHSSKGDLRNHLDAVLAIDQDLVISAVQRLVLDTLSVYQSGAHLKWNDAELAVYLIYIFGEINKSRMPDNFL